MIVFIIQKEGVNITLQSSQRREEQESLAIENGFSDFKKSEILNINKWG